jgi:hypothetical protein
MLKMTGLTSKYLFGMLMDNSLKIIFFIQQQPTEKSENMIPELKITNLFKTKNLISKMTKILSLNYSSVIATNTSTPQQSVEPSTCSTPEKVNKSIYFFL